MLNLAFACFAVVIVSVQIGAKGNSTSYNENRQLVHVCIILVITLKILIKTIFSQLSKFSRFKGLFTVSNCIYDCDKWVPLYSVELFTLNIRIHQREQSQLPIVNQPVHIYRKIDHFHSSFCKNKIQLQESNKIFNTFKLRSSFQKNTTLSLTLTRCTEFASFYS